VIEGFRSQFHGCSTLQQQRCERMPQILNRIAGTFALFRIGRASVVKIRSSVSAILFRRRASGSNQSISESGKERYEFWLPDLTATECNKLAIAIARQIPTYAYQIELTLAMTPNFLPNVGITRCWI
jgi:hypothetical protein